MKRIITLLILCMLGISLIGCSNSDINSKNATNTSNVKGQNSDKKTYCDDDFIKDIYDLINDSESDEYSTNADFDKLSPEEQEKVVKEQIVSSIQDKIDKLEKYKKLEFENKELEKLSSKYIDLLYTKKDLIANYYDLDMSDARKKDLENIKASLEQQIADYTGSDKDENNKNVG